MKNYYSPCVYFYVDKNGICDYVGKADRSLISRIKSHAKEERFIKCNKKWTIKYVAFDNPHDMDIAEVVYIKSLNPMLNEQEKTSGFFPQVIIDFNQMETFEEFVKDEKETEENVCERYPVSGLYSEESWLKCDVCSSDMNLTRLFIQDLLRVMSLKINILSPRCYIVGKSVRLVDIIPYIDGIKAEVDSWGYGGMEIEQKGGYIYWTFSQTSNKTAVKKYLTQMYKSIREDVRNADNMIIDDVEHYEKYQEIICSHKLLKMKPPAWSSMFDN